MCISSATGALLEAIASSLTEMFSPAIISERVAGMLASYDFVGADTLAYFDKRLSQAPRDADFALDYVKEHATTPETQAAVLAALALQVRRAVGRSSMRCIMPMSSRGTARRAPGSRGPGNGDGPRDA